MTAHGTYLGAVRCLDTLRLRCVIDPGCDCWHLRKASGKPFGPKEKQAVRVFGVGNMTGSRAAYYLKHGKPAPKGMNVYRTCESHDCANPVHVRAGTRQASFAARMAVGQFSTPARRRHWRELSENAERIVTRELEKWILESQQTGPEVGHALGVTKQTVNRYRQRMRARPNSVFTWAAAS